MSDFDYEEDPRYHQRKIELADSLEEAFRNGKVSEVAAYIAGLEFEKEEVVSALSETTEHAALIVAESGYDDLTKLPERNLFEKTVRPQIERNWRRATDFNLVHSLLFIDADNFKKINDELGHPAGDRTLIEMAENLRAALRPGEDVVARWGGEEFVAFLAGTDAEGAKKVASRILYKLNGIKPTNGMEAFDNFGASIGIATFPLKTPLENIIRVADDAMLQAKQQGKNRFVINTELLF